ncbi:ricin B-like lectin [Aspergillus pseudonomiae]|uniref:Ricin B-like lectin n=1 Tax=Aspergillus pseudonomiae TaxID=1506151 RepID=A0A5N7DEK6_9EURO|nr:ricin B-like lectin [Aspergillus pseudonomiae]KAE8404684.1 ricin B-like lectin [Aspergillus pseudonomiae]
MAALLNDFNGPGLYLIQAQHSKKYLDLDDSKKANHTKVQQWGSRKHHVDQKWVVAAAGRDEYLILADKAGTYLTAPEKDREPATGNLTSPTDKHVRWKFVYAEDGAYFIHSVAHPNSVLDVKGISQDDGAPVLVFSLNKQKNQQWKLVATK